jgi:hypothetical protein
VTTEKLLDSGHAPFEIDAVTTKRIVESMVNRGDLSELTAEERSRFYVQICDSLGLSPATLPFAILRPTRSDSSIESRDRKGSRSHHAREYQDGHGGMPSNAPKQSR